jgi:hypothetical protein
MTRPIPDKAEVAIEYPDKLYIARDAMITRPGTALATV